jgi:Domain of unknown function (DUF4326)
MTRPVRLRLSRAKGFNLQAHSLAVNGLPAVKVDRSTMFGNPFVVAREGANGRDVVDLYRRLLEGETGNQHAAHPHEVRHRREYAVNNMSRLRGKNLACWCDGRWCHADVLLEIANGFKCEVV